MPEPLTQRQFAKSADLVSDRIGSVGPKSSNFDLIPPARWHRVIKISVQFFDGISKSGSG